MKKLIVLSVVLALIAGSAFAVDLSGIVFGGANVIQGSTADGDDDVVSTGYMKRIRLQGEGANDDGTFGGWIRAEAGGFEGIAWWQPIDMFKLSVGGNSDGIWGKEGVTGWSFYQMASDANDIVNQGNVWGGDNRYGQPFKFRTAFYNGFGDERVFMTISPMEILDINIGIPFLAKSGEKTSDVFKAIDAQVDLKLDFGNIAITYRGAPTYVANAGWDGAGSVIYGYFGGSFGDLSLDVGIGFQLKNDAPPWGGEETSNPIAFGVGVKYATDAFGVKARVGALVGGEDSDPTDIVVDLLPYFKLSDSLSAFISVGLGMMMPDEGDTVIGWHFNPYIQVGQEWGPAFYAGISVSSNGKWVGTDMGDYTAWAPGDSYISWSIPIGIQVSF